MARAGFPSAAAYSRERLGLSPRKASALIALERKTWDAPALATAYREGTLSWLRALAIMPVVTPIGLSLLWLSALLTLYTGWDYFRAGVRHLIED